MSISVIGWMDIIGTIAFAVSGAVTGAQKKMDIFGVCILAVVTACGGGMFRDIMIGRTPPAMFEDPRYALLATMTAVVVFTPIYTGKLHLSPKAKIVYEDVLFVCDTLGLAAFTVDGVYVGRNAGVGGNLFLMVVLGVLTGVGGGVVRDVLSMQMPAIFVRHVYACACIVGALVCALLMRMPGMGEEALPIGFVCVIVIRGLARHFKWNLPRIK